MSEEAFVKWACSKEVHRVEWVEGEVQHLPPPNFDHVDLQNWLSRVLGLYVEAHDLGVVVGPEYMVRLLPDNPRRRVPDLLFVTQSRTHLIKKDGLHGPPDLAVEVVSPDDPSRDYRVKYLEYEQAGVKEYWILDPNAKLSYFYARTRGGKFVEIPLVDGVVRSKAVKGFAIDPAILFAAKRPTALKVLKQLGVL
jgi:Uma2 family endonuclease